MYCYYYNTKPSSSQNHSLLLQIFIEQEQGKRIIGRVEQVLYVSGISGQFSDPVCVTVHEMVLQERGDLGIVELGTVSRGLPVNVMCGRGHLLFDVESLRQALELQKLDGFTRVTGDFWIQPVEVHLATSFGDVLDEVEGVMPGRIGEATEQLVESGTVLLVVREMSRH